MQQKALIIESTRLFQNVIEQIMHSAGVECFIYSSGKEALEASHHEYTFILVSRTLKDISGEVFLQLFGVKHGLGDALTIMLTSKKTEGTLLEANKAGYKLVFNKKDILSLEEFIVRIVNSRTLELEANILLIEDSQSVANLIMSLFKANKSSIHHVMQLSEMQTAFQEADFDLVITDYYLQEKETGDDVITFIRQFDDTDKSTTPILVISGETNQNKRTSFLRNGANDFILKPYDDDELLVRSSNLITNHRLLKQSKQQQHQLMKLALTDQLTGLYNRHSLNDLGPKFISNAHRHKLPLSLFVIDLDHFKNVNDTYGHAVGDLVLKAIAAVLYDTCRTEDIVARFGGEEFIMMLTNCGLAKALEKGEQLRAAIESCKPEDLVITSSIGVAELIADDTFDTLFNRADKAVYEAKETGRNKVVAAEAS